MEKRSEGECDIKGKNESDSRDGRKDEMSNSRK